MLCTYPKNFFTDLCSSSTCNLRKVRYHVTVSCPSVMSMVWNPTGRRLSKSICLFQTSSQVLKEITSLLDYIWDNCTYVCVLRTRECWKPFRMNFTSFKDFFSYYLSYHYVSIYGLGGTVRRLVRMRHLCLQLDTPVTNDEMKLLKSASTFVFHVITNLPVSYHMSLLPNWIPSKLYSYFSDYRKVKSIDVFSEVQQGTN